MARILGKNILCCIPREDAWNKACARRNRLDRRRHCCSWMHRILQEQVIFPAWKIKETLFPEFFRGPKSLTLPAQAGRRHAPAWPPVWSFTTWDMEGRMAREQVWITTETRPCGRRTLLPNC